MSQNPPSPGPVPRRAPQRALRPPSLLHAVGSDCQIVLKWKHMLLVPPFAEFLWAQFVLCSCNHCFGGQRTGKLCTCTCPYMPLTLGCLVALMEFHEWYIMLGFPDTQLSKTKTKNKTVPVIFIQVPKVIISCAPQQMQFFVCLF